ncbi:hypothetical protein Tco_1428732, partial [Tanacetum coccineum]
DSHISHASGLGDGTDLGLGVPDEQQRKKSGIDEGTGTKLGVPDVPIYEFESETESWGESVKEDDDDEDVSDDDGDDDDDDDDNDDDDDDEDKNDDDDEADNDRTESDRIKIPDLNQSRTEYDEKNEEHESERVHTPPRFIPTNDEDKGVADQQNVSQEFRYEQVEEDAHVTLTAIHETQKTDGQMQSSSVSSNFTSKLLNLENPSPTKNEIASLMGTTIRREEPSNFSSVFKFNDRVTKLEKDVSELKQVDQYAQSISLIPAIVDCYIDNKLGESINKSIQSHTVKCGEEALAEKKEYIDLIDISVRAIIKEDVNTQLPQSTNVAAASLSEFKLTKIRMDKMEEHKSYQSADYKREIYDALVKSYNTDKDLFESYGNVFTLKRSRDDKDKDQDPSVGLDRGTKRKKSSKEVESARDSRSKEKKSSTTSKGTSHSQHKSSGKSGHADEPSHTVDDSGVQQNQELDTGYNDEQSADKAASKVDWFKKPKRPPTPDLDWNKRQHVDFRPPQTWISQVTHAEEPSTSFDELVNTLIDFFAFVLNRLNITDLNQAILVGPAFNLLKGTCKSRTKLEYHFEECFKAVNDRLDWTNPEGHQYPFDLSKPLPLLEVQGRQVVPADYFINNDLEYLKGGSLSRKYTNSTTITRAAKYNNIEGIEDMVPMLWSPTLHKFKEGDFPNLNMRDIEDMLLLLVQKKISNLERGIIFDLNVALQMFTRSIVIQKRVEDLQLGVESYQKKLNITRNTDGISPKMKMSGIRQPNRLRLWIMCIDKQLYEKRLMRNLEKFIGGREYRNDLRMLERTI